MDKKCPYCGGSINEDKCTNCGAMVPPESQLDPDEAPAFEHIPGVGANCDEDSPWERMKELGFFPALIDTVKKIIFEASTFFEGMPKHGGYGMPLLYAIIFGAIGGVIGQLWSLLAQSLSIAPLAMFGLSEQATAMSGQMAFGFLGFFLGIIIVPIAVTIGTFVQAGIYHLMLMLLGGAEEDFEVTFRVVAYSKTAEIAKVVPIAGSLVATIWGIILCINGLREAHNIENKVAVWAVLLPMIVCCLFTGVIVMIFGGAMLAAFSSMARGGL
ncbi:YIP1 family protein [bacterium]|nr:YIP1 family protein [bacterium]